MLATSQGLPKSLQNASTINVLKLQKDGSPVTSISMNLNITQHDSAIDNKVAVGVLCNHIILSFPIFKTGLYHFKKNIIEFFSQVLFLFRYFERFIIECFNSCLNFSVLFA